MDDENRTDGSKVQVGNNGIAVGGINIGGDASGNIHIGNTGYTSDEVSSLLKEITSTFQPKPFDGRCPYKGLDVFEEEDAELFFGREKLVDDLVSRVKDSRTVFVTGPSGSGKSSLVRAGLIHALKQGAIKNSERWLYATMKPGRDPLESFATAFSRLKSPELGNYFRQHVDQVKVLHECAESALTDNKNQRLVLFIDQFEEVFTQINKEEERVAFLNLLTHAATVENGRMIILFSMRSDFISNCATYPRLNALYNQKPIQIGAMEPEELVSAIAQPALRVGLRIDPDLIAQIINEMKGEPGTLPLMQFALKDLFDFQQAKSDVIALTLNDYLQRGGIHKALERHADDSFAKLSKDEQELARSIFSGLIEIGRGTQDTKRTALFDELVPANAKAEEIEAIVQKLADARLITTDEQAGKDTVTISHEKLIDAWPWLKKLVNENRDGIALQNEIKSDAKEWDEHQRDASYLYIGARLINACEQLEAKNLNLNVSANEFLQAGWLRQQRDQRARTFSISGVVGLVIAGILLFAYISTSNSKQLAEQSKNSASTQQAIASTAQANEQEAKKQAAIARAGELDAQALSQRDINLPLSSLLSVEAYNSADIARSRETLLDNIQTDSQLVQYMFGNSGVYSVAYSPDGKILASGGADKEIILWDMTTYQPIGQPLVGHSGEIYSVAFSPDGEILASGGSTDDTIILWNTKTRQPIAKLIDHHSVLQPIYVVFSPDGKKLVSRNGSGQIDIWNLETHLLIGKLSNTLGDSLISIAFSPDGKILASGYDSGFPTYTGKIIFWNIDAYQPIGQPLTGLDSGVLVAFSPNGKIFASVSQSKQGYKITIWDTITLQPLSKPSNENNLDSISSMAFTPDSKILILCTFDGTIILWDTETNQPSGQPLSGNEEGQVRNIALSPNGETLAFGSTNKIITVWDIGQHQFIGQSLTGYSAPINSIAFSPDGKTLAFGNGDGTILWDVTTHQPIGQPLTGHTTEHTDVRSVAFSPDGKTLASDSCGKEDRIGNCIEGEIILWDVATRQPVGRPLKGHTDKVRSVAFSPDGKMLASGSWDHTIILWDVATRQPIGQPLKGHASGVFSVFSPDGKTLASGSSYDGVIILWDVSTHQPIGKGHASGVTSVAFSPNGKTLASGGYDGTIILWDVGKLQPIGNPLIGHSEFISSVAFSPDGKMLASGGCGYTNKYEECAQGSINLWDTLTHRSIGQPITMNYDAITEITFDPEGKILASASINGAIFLWDTDPLSWVKKTCERVGRNFSREEWSQYFPDEEYRKTCEQWRLEPEAIASPTPTP